MSTPLYTRHSTVTVPTQLVLEDELAADDSTDTMDLKIMPSTSTALRLNNNMLNSWEGFSETVGKLFVQHTEHLCWLDLSFNELRTIDDVSVCVLVCWCECMCVCWCECVCAYVIM